MMDARHALEALDAKAGRVHTREDAARVYEKLLSRPASILDDDLTIVRYFHGDKTADDYAATRAKAIAGPPADPPATGTRATAARNLRKHFDAYSEALADALKPIFASYRTKIAALEQEIERLKARPLQKWAGVHVEGTQYSEASLVTRSGSLWVAVKTTTSTPGDAGGDWRLIVKRGHV